MSFLDYILFGIYPYIAIAIFLLGSLIRFDRVKTNQTAGKNIAIAI